MITFLNNVKNALSQVINGIKAIFELITTTIEFIPEPFLTITLIFIPVIIASIMYKILRG